MPLENRPRTTVGKPLTPTLSSNLRTRPALAPRLATSGPTSPATTSQRSLRQQTLSPDRADQDRTKSLNSNITPRSGARASRVDTDSPSTPDTSARSRTAVFANREDTQNSHGFGIISPTPVQSRLRPKSSDQLSTLPTVTRVSGESTNSQITEEAKFFRVDDVRSNVVVGKTGSSRPRSTYIAETKSPRVSPKKVTSEASDKLDDKFVYANSISAQPNTRPRTLLASKFSASASTISTTRSLPVQNSSQSPTATRAPIQTPAVRTTTSNSPQSHVGRKRANSNTPSAVSSLDRRRSSSLNIKPVVTSTDTGHRKSISTNSAAITTTKTDVLRDSDRRPQILHAQSESILRTTVLISPDSSSNRSASLASAQTTATSVISDSIKSDVQPIRPPLLARHTRGSSDTTQLQPITQAQIEAAANARRERKVLDLEISNSSLLAINRTLEKELRKQNTELRRFRRLSRSGRLSLTPSHRIVSGASISTLTTLDEDEAESIQTAGSPISSDGGSYDENDFPSDEDNDSSFTESSDVLRRRARDEKRLMHDLQRHQQILLDSQKLTQSIQRCLNSTEELIKDGAKALAYQVEANEVQIGGRVLNRDDDEALSEVDFSEYTQSMTRPRQGLLSPTLAMKNAEEAAMWARSLQESGGLDPPIELLRQGTTESPSPTLSPIILPER